MSYKQQNRGKPFRGGGSRGRSFRGGHRHSENRQHPYEPARAETNQQTDSGDQQYRRQLNKIPVRPAPKFDFDDLSSQAFEIAECNADLLWIAQLKRYIRGDGKYTIKFPDVRGYPGEERLRTVIQASVAASEQQLTEDIMNHLQAEEQTVRRDRQRLLNERAQELSMNDNRSAPTAPPPQAASVPDDWLQMNEEERNAIRAILNKSKAKKLEPSSPEGQP